MNDAEKEIWDEMQADAVPLAVECARCGKPGSSENFMLEEGDEWECPDCWMQCEIEERAAPRR
jgi:DNA-directed RNA polymerase subunit RPC12/RpoP